MMSPLLARRLQNFKSNRRGYVSFWLLVAVVLISVFAPVIANDRPIVMSFDGKILFPIVQDFPETYFGGDFGTVADYRDPYVQKLISAHGWMVFPPIHYRFDTINYHLPSPAPSPPTWENWLGTDDQGRDVVARLIYGVRVSLAFAFILTSLSSIVGIMAGAVQGFFGGVVDLLYRNLVGHARFVFADYHGIGHCTRLLAAADLNAAVFVDVFGGRRARGIPACA